MKMSLSLNLVSCVIVLLCCTYNVQGYITYIASRLPLQGQRPPPGSPWPLPQQWTQDPLLFTLDPSNFTLISDLKHCDVIDQALHRYKELILADKNGRKDPGLQAFTQLHVRVFSKQCEKYPGQDTEEIYFIDIHKDGAHVSAGNIWGVLKGLETFSQLVYSRDGRYQINQTRIRDWPRFQYRGLLLDTARHYIRESVILQVLEAMSYNKFNVFHWHLVDDQSFPYVSKTFPELSEKGAFSPRHVYTQAVVARVIEFARVRGIRVIPEFDTPGHTQSWGRSHPELLTPCWVDEQPYRDLYGDEGYAKSEVFDPTRTETFEFLREFFSEIVDVFPDEYVDLGMDEAHYYCWQSSPNISQFMRDRGFGPGDYYKVEGYYDSKLIRIVQDLGAKVFIYQDPIENGAQVEESTVVRVWKGEAEWQGYAYNITNLGHNITVSSCYYLNYISYGEDWRKYYLCDPQNFGGTEKQKDRVLGGEVSMWDEYVDETNLLSRLWPRASAVAERLWSSADVNETDSAVFRLDEHRCRMRRRGIPAEPLLPGHCDELDLETESASRAGPTNNKCTPSSSWKLAISSYIFVFSLLVHMSLSVRSI